MTRRARVAEKLSKILVARMEAAGMPGATVVVNERKAQVIIRRGGRVEVFEPIALCCLIDAEQSFDLAVVTKVMERVFDMEEEL